MHKVMEEELTYRNLHDDLTGLDNRVLFVEHLIRAMLVAKRRHSSYAVLLFDLDRFKMINDALGHPVGDRLLIDFARRLEIALRPNDKLARLGGDEFAVLLENVSSCDAEAVAARLCRTLESAFRIDANALVMTASIGIAAATGETYAKPEELLRDADVAMYRAKSLGRSRIVVFERAMRVNAVNAMTLEQELRAAVERGSFSLMFQPIVDARSLRIRSFEALLRWDSPDRGRVMPADFVPLAEETGLIIPIGEWVIFHACQWLASLSRLNRCPSDLKVSVNVAAHQLSAAGFTRCVERSLAVAKADPRCLSIEITESALFAHRDTSMGAIRELRELGVDVHIDDFGTGYSSFEHLQLIAATGLKLDKSFMSEGPEPRKRAIVEAMVNLGHLLEMTVTAEGIETAQHLNDAQAAGCDLVQGYYLAHPLTPGEALHYLGGPAD